MRFTFPPIFSTFSIAFFEAYETSMIIGKDKSPTSNNFNTPFDLLKIFFSNKIDLIIFFELIFYFSIIFLISLKLID